MHIRKYPLLGLFRFSGRLSRSRTIRQDIQEDVHRDTESRQPYENPNLKGILPLPDYKYTDNFHRRFFGSCRTLRSFRPELPCSVQAASRSR